jgi:adenine/guanine phosphoribosyltransferase-like PRPP-binding protein
VAHSRLPKLRRLNDRPTVIGLTNSAEIMSLLAKGGLAEADVEAIVAGAESRPVPRFSVLRDPSATEALARALAAEVAPLTPTRVLLWAEDDAVLAFVVAKELGCSVTKAGASEGLLECDPPIEKADRVVVLAESFRTAGAFQALRSLAEHHGAGVVAGAALVDTPTLRTEGGGVQVIALVGQA